MTTIHITIEDSHEALSALAAILNLDIGFDIRIDLDEMDDDVDHAITAATNALDLLNQITNDHSTKRNDDKLRGYAYALDAGDQIADRVVGSVHYSGGVDGSGTYTILFTNGDEWRGKGRQIVAPFGVEQRMKAKRAAEKGREIAKRIHPVVDEVDQAIRQQAYDARYAEAQEARIVKCPTCGAKPDNYCTTPGGKVYKSFAHIDRLVKARGGAK